jgi:hypothetical protein
MVERIFNDPLAWGILGIFGVLAFALSLIFKDDFDTDTSMGGALLRGLEGLVLSALGALLARSLISFLLGWANDSEVAGFVVGWGFFLIPGIVDTIVYIIQFLTGAHGHPLLSTPQNLLMYATAVGGMSGMVSGLWRIYRWDGLGWIAFPLDVTWALAGNTVGCLLHFVNFLGFRLSRLLGDGTWGMHASEIRKNAHRYEKKSFGLKPDYAFTQGAVMSNLKDGPRDDLYRHEKTHVWQNRCFGPMYTLTYVGWMAAWIIPSFFAATIKIGFTNIFRGAQDWCYFNNPWETWAYNVQGCPERTNIEGVTEDDKKLIWPPKWVIAWSIPFFLAATALAVLVVNSVWVDSGMNAVATQAHAGAQKPKSQPQSKPHGAPPPAKHH